MGLLARFQYRTLAMSLPPEQIEAVRQILEQTADYRVGPLILETALWEFHTQNDLVDRSRGLEARSKKVMFALTLFMYILSTLDWAIDVRRVWTDLKISIPAQLESPPRDESKLDTINILIRIIQAITNNICPSQLPIDVIALTCSVLINVWATGMVALRAWHCRNGIRLHLASSDRRSYTESVLTLFVESGIIYTVLWIGKNVIIIPGVADTSYTNYAIFTMNQAVGMYPTVILVLVALQRSHIEFQFTYDSSKNTAGNQDGSITFSRVTQPDWHTTSAATRNGGASDIMVTVERSTTISGMQYAHSFSDGSSDSFTENNPRKVIIHRAKVQDV
ncbi:hypothetical protein D9757_004037 [Collybiopsis confluens]|uniref:Uncharacterized protein n=1 Tax=Collybiopsis confluens TaxID=2823264 RepID=A0A8H5HWQ6_9AGAR|nr:hypothetical protein D9757_004037 [Collybiopsis confluens]